VKDKSRALHILVFLWPERVGVGATIRFGRDGVDTVQTDPKASKKKAVEGEDLPGYTTLNPGNLELCEHQSCSQSHSWRTSISLMNSPVATRFGMSMAIPELLMPPMLLFVLVPRYRSPMIPWRLELGLSRPAEIRFWLKSMMISPSRYQR